MGILDGKTVLVAGVTIDTSIGFAAAKVAQEQGASVMISNFGRALSITKRIAKRLPQPAPVLELDVTDPDHLAGLVADVSQYADRLDGVVHSIAFANPATALGGQFLETGWEDVATALRVSTYSYQALTMACRPLMHRGSSVVGLTFDATVAWPCNRYLARDLGPDGIRVNLVSAGPLRTLAAKAIPGFEKFEEAWQTRAPLGWDNTDYDAAGKAVVTLLSDLLPATTGEILHADGGFHAMGA